MDGRSNLKNVFMDRCPNDKSTAKNLVFTKSLPIPKKNWELNLLGVGINPPPLTVIGVLISVSYFSVFVTNLRDRSLFMAGGGWKSSHGIS